MLHQDVIPYCSSLLRFGKLQTIMLVKVLHDVSCGVRTHAELLPVDLKSTPLATRAN